MCSDTNSGGASVSKMRSANPNRKLFSPPRARRTQSCRMNLSSSPDLRNLTPLKWSSQTSVLMSILGVLRACYGGTSQVCSEAFHAREPFLSFNGRCPSDSITPRRVISWGGWESSPHAERRRARGAVGARSPKRAAARGAIIEAVQPASACGELGWSGDSVFGIHL